MMKFSGVFTLVCTALLASAAVAGDRVYKYVDEDGIVHYTNIRPAGVANLSTLNFPCYASDPRCRGVDWENVPLRPTLFAAEIATASEQHTVDAALVRAIIHAESAYRPDAVSPKGAQGLMQLMPATQARLEVPDAFDPAGNIDGGTRYLAWLLNRYGGDVELATAAYNAGEGAVDKYGGIPPYAETREYVRRVGILYRRYRQPTG